MDHKEKTCVQACWNFTGRFFCVRSISTTEPLGGVDTDGECENSGSEAGTGIMQPISIVRIYVRSECYQCHDRRSEKL